MKTALCNALVAGSLIAAQPQDYRVVSEVRLVVLDVSVRDQSGKAVVGLGRGAFRVLDSGRETSLAAFGGEDTAVTIALVVDTSASMRVKRRDVALAVDTFVSECNPGDEIMAVTFNDRVSALGARETSSLGASLGAAVMDGRTALFDGIDAGLTMIGKGTRERKVAVVISDGGDNASRLNRRRILERAGAANVTIYAIGIFQESSPDADPGFLRQIARLTGGDARIGVESGELRAVCSEIAREIRARYMLAFHASEARRRETRPIRVLVAAPNVERPRVLCRRSYVAGPAPEARP
ncbi:MAG: VWA domain-containing protein [Bryobacteraceae bacterium]